MWGHAEPLRNDQLPPGLMALSPTEQLLHVCLHGVQHDSRVNRLWALDALLILQNTERRVDFARLVEIARARRLTVPLEDALRLLATLTPLVPIDVLQRLGEIPVHPLERLEYRGLTSGWRGAGARGREAMMLLRALRKRHERLDGEMLPVPRSDAGDELATQRGSKLRA
jgi:hypothetical protein